MRVYCILVFACRIVVMTILSDSAYVWICLP